jgi:hypothetical protein
MNSHFLRFTSQRLIGDLIMAELPASLHTASLQRIRLIHNYLTRQA